jgi:serine/threonine-protein kinase
MPLDLPSAGRYEILEKIGAGGMGSVYRAKDPVIGRAVAVKAIVFADVADPKERREMQIRTAREARSAGMLSHPNIVTVHDLVHDSVVAYIVMELVEGKTLWELFCAKGRLEKTEFLGIIKQSAAALDYAHEHGVIHRDVKPSNILVRGDGVAKLTDFGVAKILAAEQLTRTGLVVGTPNYMAPEQIREQNVTPASDQFGLAVIAYELLTGSKPFDGGTFSSLLYKIRSEAPPRAAEYNPFLPAGVENVLDRALSKDPAKRFESCGAFAKALEEACATLPDYALGERKKTEPAAPPDSAEASVAKLSLEQLRKVDSTKNLNLGDTPLSRPVEPRGNRMLVIGAVAAIVLVLAIVAGLMMGGGSSGQEEPETKKDGPIVLAESGSPNQSQPAAAPEPAATEPAAAEPVETEAASPPPAPSPKAQPKVAAQQPAAAPPPTSQSQPATSSQAPLLVGATITIVWRGELDPGAELRIEGDKASIGEISRGLPGDAVQIEVSPNVLEILEAPSAANNWSRLRLLNGGDRVRRYFLIRCKSL